MAKLTVEATGGSSAPVAETVSPAKLCVSVTDEEEKPVDGLSENAFTFTLLDTVSLADAEGFTAAIELDSIYGAKGGFYVVHIKAVPFAWPEGRIIFGLAVERTRVVGEGPGPAKTGPVLAKVEPAKLGGPAKVGPAKPAPTITDVGQTVVAIEVISA
jgi:hypothetical protein